MYVVIILKTLMDFKVDYFHLKTCIIGMSLDVCRYILEDTMGLSIFFSKLLIGLGTNSER